MSNFCQFNGGYWNDQNTVKYQIVTAGASASDALGPFTVTKVLAEAIAAADVMLLALSRTLIQFVFAGDTLTLSLRKVFPETVRVKEWLEIKRLGSGWTNEES